LKAVTEKNQITYKGKPIKIIANFSTGTWLKWGGKIPKLIKLEWKRGDNNKHQRNPENHLGLLWRPIFK
jgi:hypothetical protein